MTITLHNPPTVFTPVGPYSHAVEVADARRLLFISGTMGLEADGAVPATIEEQLDVLWSNIVKILAGAVIGASLGDWLSYEVGRYLEDRAHHTWPLNRYPDLIRKGEDFTRRWGVWAIFLGRFFGPARAFVPLVAGIFEMPRGPFQLANIGSALIWAYMLLTVGDVSGAILGRMWG
jgi:membrane protein YqaA with SNARE-associated domain